MTIKLILIKSGEDLISDVAEMAVGEEEERRVIGYYLTKPCVVKMRNPNVIDNGGTDSLLKNLDLRFPYIHGFHFLLMKEFLFLLIGW